MSSKNSPCNVGGTASPGLFTSTVTRAWAAPVLNGTADAAASEKTTSRRIGFVVRVFICLLMRCGGSFCQRHFHFRPAMGIPAEGQDGQRRHPATISVVKMATQPVGAVFRKNPHLTRPDEGTVGRQKQAAATGHQIRSVLVEIRPGDFLAPADPDLVGAVRTPATASPIYKQVIKTVVPINIGRFDGIIKSERIQG